mmetsp:Transcript_15880/g.20021  ORF Transcript_15880/g.20021 Transcript_15880/m.20021 type:complete len:213 (+) Transcript_15880:233-871(+)
MGKEAKVGKQRPTASQSQRRGISSRGERHLHLSLERNRRMVQEDAHLLVLTTLVAEGVLHLDLVTGGRAGKVIVAHGEGNAINCLNLMVVIHTVRPPIASVDGESPIFLVTNGHSLVANEVRHGVFGAGAELRGVAFCGFEHDIAVAVAVELSRGLSRSGNIVSSLSIDCGDALDGGRPAGLNILHLLDSDRCTNGAKDRGNAVSRLLERNR